MLAAHWIAQFPHTLSLRTLRAARKADVIRAYPYGRGFAYTAGQIISILTWLADKHARPYLARETHDSQKADRIRPFSDITVALLAARKILENDQID